MFMEWHKKYAQLGNLPVPDVVLEIRHITLRVLRSGGQTSPPGNDAQSEGQDIARPMSVELWYADVRRVASSIVLG